MSDSSRKTSNTPAWILGALFALAIAGAWAWFNVSPKRFPVSYAFHPKSVVAGWTFHPEPVPEQAREILATTNLFNGAFTNASGERITVFVGTWDANNPKQMSVVGHTPDICWVGAGWTPFREGHPEKMTITNGGHAITFEVRTFKTPDQRSKELTVWCTLVSGQVFEEEGKYELPEGLAGGSPQERRTPGARRALKTQLVKAVSSRIAGTGAKQFVRFSTPIHGNWETAFGKLMSFGEQWLDIVAHKSDAQGDLL